MDKEKLLKYFIRTMMEMLDRATQKQRGRNAYLLGYPKASQDG